VVAGVVLGLLNKLAQTEVPVVAQRLLILVLVVQELQGKDMMVALEAPEQTKLVEAVVEPAVLV
jgi:hypothetical protein